MATIAGAKDLKVEASVTLLFVLLAFALYFKASWCVFMLLQSEFWTYKCIPRSYIILYPILLFLASRSPRGSPLRERAC